MAALHHLVHQEPPWPHHQNQPLDFPHAYPRAKTLARTWTHRSHLQPTTMPPNTQLPTKAPSTDSANQVSQSRVST